MLYKLLHYIVQRMIKKMQLHLFGSFATETSDTKGRQPSFHTMMLVQYLPLNYVPKYHLLKHDWQDCSIRFP